MYKEHHDKSYKWNAKKWKLGRDATPKVRLLMRYFCEVREILAQRENMNVGEYTSKSVSVEMARECHEFLHERKDRTYTPQYEYGDGEAYFYFLESYPKLSWTPCDGEE